MIHSFRFPVRALCAGAALAAAAGAWAVDLGTVGPVHAIQERNAIEYIQSRIADMRKSGELAKWEEDTKRRAAESIRNPTPITGLAKTRTARTYYIDPTYTVPQDIKGPDGKLMYAAGFKVNPLQVVGLSQHLLFFDARDPQQVTLAQDLMKHYEGKVKPILVGGSPIRLMRDWKVQVFFDQAGTLTSRFGITQVPALVSQEGQSLRVDELKVRG